MNPSSSAMTEKMKSVCAAPRGRKPRAIWSARCQPLPMNPPEPTEIIAWRALVGFLPLVVVRLRLFRGRGRGLGEIHVEIRQQSVPLVVLQLDLPPAGRGEKHVHQEQRAHQHHPAAQHHQIPPGCARHQHHHQSGGHHHQRRPQVGFLHDEQERQEHQAERLPEIERLAEVHPPGGQVMGHRQNQRELRKFRGLQLKTRQVNPPPRAAVRGTDVRDQHGDENEDGGPVGNEGPAGEGVIIHQADGQRRRQPDREPDDLLEEKLVVPRRPRPPSPRPPWRCKRTRCSTASGPAPPAIAAGRAGSVQLVVWRTSVVYLGQRAVFGGEAFFPV